MNYNFWFSLKFEKFSSYFHKFLCILIWNILILLSSFVVFVMILSLKGLQVLCSQYFQVLEIVYSLFIFQRRLLNVLKDFILE